MPNIKEQMENWEKHFAKERRKEKIYNIIDELPLDDVKLLDSLDTEEKEFLFSSAKRRISPERIEEQSKQDRNKALKLAL